MYHPTEVRYPTRISTSTNFEFDAPAGSENEYSDFEENLLNIASENAPCTLSEECDARVTTDTGTVILRFEHCIASMCLICIISRSIGISTFKTTQIISCLNVHIQ